MDATTDITAETLDTMLRRIRGLLDKAEATDVEAEQELFFGKASDLMARYRIDNAMVEASRPKASRGEILFRRVNLGSGPYVRARLTLIDVVARAFGCTVLTGVNWEGRYANVHGYDSDVATVEALYTSLLVQVTRAMKATPTPRHDHGTTFRRTFIESYAYRVGQRLRDQTRELIEAADAAATPASTPAPADGSATPAATPEAGSSGVALVLSDRKADVDDYLAKRYGKIRSLAPSSASYSHSGAEAGRAAGGRADIATGGRVSSGARGLNA